MSFGDVIKTGFITNSDPAGIGGNSDVVWHCEDYNDRVFELATSNLSVIRSGSATYKYPHGIGGDSNVIWHSNRYPSKIYELATSNFSVIRSATPPGSYLYGIGGDSNVIWHSDGNPIRIYELDTSDFSVIRYGTPSSTPRGIGGDSNVIWAWFGGLNELDVSDFSIIRSASAPGGDGLGGDSNVIWAADWNYVHELDATRPVIINYQIDSTKLSDYAKKLDSTIIVTNHGVVSVDEVVNICYGTGTPPVASTTTEGTLFIRHGAVGTNSQINIADAWEDVDLIQINIGDAWKTVNSIEINIGDTWKTVF